MRPKIDKVITIAYHCLSLVSTSYLPIQNVKDIDYKNFTNFRAQWWSKLLINTDRHLLPMSKCKKCKKIITLTKWRVFTYSYISKTS